LIHFNHSTLSSSDTFLSFSLFPYPLLERNSPPSLPCKIQDLLWKISHFSLPVGPPVTSISPYSNFCPYCPLTSNSICHLFSLCSITSSLQTLTSNLLSQTSSSSSFLYLLSSRSISSNHKHIIRLIFSSFLWTIWTSYTSYTFGSSSPPSLPDIYISFYHNLLHNKSLFPSPSWPSTPKIKSIIYPAISSSLPPPPTILI